MGGAVVQDDDQPFLREATVAQATVAEPTLTDPGQDYVNIYDHIHHR